MSVLHKSTKRDYLARVNDLEFPKAKAAALAKKFSEDYWDGDRRLLWGYRYISRWRKLLELSPIIILPEKPKILDVGCE